ncbi:Helix-turn-helix domain-containing protein [Mucilaginibacter lappiensis]|uniref:AraC-like DNA-binding protein n=1 Tax=Mucilaginibacter lappiensis TaxID=354630 RepID=A0ABR6PE13_9SPHI|nr:helix-turn-helix domain-containing protein [Mucilaginibacter lappiensis]MBB6107997.1 AraC-like DNA-binding protein [Mucilaginibacter lappiensis]SIP90066.1 Helix-turn-helix domain-containing protein [Mucilaginibacter lappiensis]
MPINYLKKIQLGEFNADGYRISPATELESVVEGFYIFARDPMDNTHLIFNDGFPVLVFLQNREDTVMVTGQSNAFEIKAAWASAGSIKNIYVKYNNNTDPIFIVRFYPGAFYRLFGLDALYFRYNPVAPFEYIARNNNFSIKGFFEHNSIEEKVAFVETYVQHSFTEIDTPETLHKTLNYIHKIKGKSTVRNVTHDAGVNYKWLERSFVQHIGLLPKEYIQLQRFIHAYLELVGNEDVNLMRIAISNGYYDANHFLKDFKAYTGKTPLEYLKFQSHADLRQIS